MQRAIELLKKLNREDQLVQNMRNIAVAFALAGSITIWILCFIESL